MKDGIKPEDSAEEEKQALAQRMDATLCIDGMQHGE